MTDDELLSAVRESFAGARLNAPLDATIQRGRTLRARRRWGGLAVAGLLSRTPGQPAPAAGPTPPASLAAWTVTKGPGHTVTILVRELRDPAGLRRTLRADGIPAAVAFQGGLLSDTPPLPRTCRDVHMSDTANADLQGRIIGPGMAADPRAVALVIHTAEIPRGIGLNLTVQADKSGYGWSLGLVRASPACTGS
jgi:hypothetical protein